MRKLPLVRTPVSAVVLVLGFAACALLCLMPLTMPTGLMILYTAGPFMLPLTLMLAGTVPAYLCLAVSAGCLFLLFGFPGLAVGLVYLGSMLAVFHVLCVREARFRTVALSAVLTLVLSQTALYAWLQAAYHRQAFQAAADAMTDWFLQNSGEGDILLYLLNSSGLLPLSSSFQGAGFESGYVLTDAARSDLLSALSALVVGMLNQMTTAMIVGMSLYLGAAAALIPERAASAFRKRRLRLGDGDASNPPVPIESAPRLKTWHLPRGWGLKVGILAAGYLLQTASTGALQVLGRICFEVFSAVFTIQGVALINHLQVGRRHRKGWRIAVPLLLCMILPNAMYIVGVFDQILDPRHLRAREEEQPPEL